MYHIWQHFSCTVLVVVVILSALVENRSYNNGLIFYDLQTQQAFLPPTVSVSRGRDLANVKYSDKGSIWSTFGKPCDCAGEKCGCCAGIKVKQYNFNEKMCANITFIHQKDEAVLDVYLGDKPSARYGISARNPSPFCIPVMVGIPMAMCVQMSNIAIQGNNLNMCMDFIVRLATTDLIEMHFQCMRMGLDGVQYLDKNGQPVLPPGGQLIKYGEKNEDEKSAEYTEYYDELATSAENEIETNENKLVDQQEEELHQQEEGEEEEDNGAEVAYNGEPVVLETENENVLATTLASIAAEYDNGIADYDDEVADNEDDEGNENNDMGYVAPIIAAAANVTEEEEEGAKEEEEKEEDVMNNKEAVTENLENIESVENSYDVAAATIATTTAMATFTTTTSTTTVSPALSFATYAEGEANDSTADTSASINASAETSAVDASADIANIDASADAEDDIGSASNDGDNVAAEGEDAMASTESNPSATESNVPYEQTQSIIENVSEVVATTDESPERPSEAYTQAAPVKFNYRRLKRLNK